VRAQPACQGRAADAESGPATHMIELRAKRAGTVFAAFVVLTGPFVVLTGPQAVGIETQHRQLTMRMRHGGGLGRLGGGIRLRGGPNSLVALSLLLL
jgi:hypothetical protein